MQHIFVKLYWCLKYCYYKIPVTRWLTQDHPHISYMLTPLGDVITNTMEKMVKKSTYQKNQCKRTQVDDETEAEDHNPGENTANHPVPPSENKYSRSWSNVTSD